MPSLLFVAGDPSGDAHAARLIEALRTAHPPLSFVGLGGPAMQRAGLELLDDLTQASAIGPADAARQLGRLRRARQQLEAYLTAHRPDLAVLVDFGDFNLPIVAPRLKRQGIRIAYYISPQLWAWGRFRLRYVQQYVDRMLVLFKFEETFYQQHGIPVTWVGHPLVEHARPTIGAAEARERFGLNAWRRTVGLLPGSRPQELMRHLPLMMEAAGRIAWRMPGVQFVLPLAPGLPRAAVEARVAQGTASVRIAEGAVYDALQVMEAAVVASGTATLEAALCGVPMAVIYRTSWPTYWLARAVIRIPHIALVNVVAQRALVPEFIQHRAAPAHIADEVVALLRDDARCALMREGFRDVAAQLGPPGAVDRAASAILELLR